jgi:hypothetical protein
VSLDAARALLAEIAERPVMDRIKAAMTPAEQRDYGDPAYHPDGAALIARAALQTVEEVLGLVLDDLESAREAREPRPRSLTE